MKAIKQIKSTGEIVHLSGDITLEQAQTYVGGYIEPVAIPPYRTMQIGVPVMLVNEEGFIYNLPHNMDASLMTGKKIVGDVLIINWEEGDR